jgi:hypothetical protein
MSVTSLDTMEAMHRASMGERAAATSPYGSPPGHGPASPQSRSPPRPVAQPPPMQPWLEPQ